MRQRSLRLIDNVVKRTVGTIEPLGSEGGVVVGKSDGFTDDQIEFLQSEFDRQRKLIGSITQKENEALIELERTKGSWSYKIGRAITWPFRQLKGILGRGRAIEVIVQNDDLDEVFPEMEISPEFVPSSPREVRAASLSQKILISLRENRLSSNEIRDLLRNQCKEISGEEAFFSVVSLTKHIVRNRGYSSYVKSFYVGSGICRKAQRCHKHLSVRRVHLPCSCQNIVSYYPC